MECNDYQNDALLALGCTWQNVSLLQVPYLVANPLDGY